MTPDELEERLGAEAEARNKAMVEAYRASESKSLAEIEQATLDLGKQMKEAALREMGVHAGGRGTGSAAILLR